MNGKGPKRANPREGAGFISAAAFIWILPILRNSARYFRSLEDIFDPLLSDRSQFLGDQMEKAWLNEIENARKNKTSPSLIKIFFKIHKRLFIISALMIFLVEFLFRLLTPICLIEFIRHFDNKDRDILTEDLFLASTAGLVLAPFLTVFLNHGYHLLVFHIGMKLRIGVSSLIYRKVLSLRKCDLNGLTTGHIINLLSMDAGRLDFIGSFFFDILIGPVQVMAVGYCLWQLLGPASLVGIATIVSSIPLTVWLGKMISVMRLKTSQRTDERVHTMSEIVSGIQVIKMYVWEKPFQKLIETIRQKEISVIKKLSYIRGVLYSLPMFHTRLATFLTLTTYVLTGNNITASKAFVLTSFINVLQLTVADYFPQGASQISEFLISVNRIEKFLLTNIKEHSYMEELGVMKSLNSYLATDEATSVPRNEIGVSLKNVCARWSDKDILNNISFEVNSGHLTAVIGSVGAGKTSLFYTILKELEVTSGDMKLLGRVSYASQEPWLFPASIKNNILFGETYNEKRFREVLKACTLDKDIDSFFYQERTLVGERGVKLSGGQKARISLARALYKDADIYLLDDPLSAVDTNVQKQLFEKCITGLLKEKAVLLITHQLQYLKDVNEIVVMENGSIKCIGDYESLQESGFDFSIYLRKSDGNEEINNGINSVKQIKKNKESVAKDDEEDTLLTEEFNKKNMKLNIFWFYFKEGGNYYVLLSIFMVFMLAQTAASGGDYWTSYWVNLEDHVFPENSTLVTNNIMKIFNHYPSRDICIYIFTFLVLSNMNLSLLRTSWFYAICMKASRKFHNKMFKAVSRSPMLFFNDNPSGRILNRFSKDIGIIDEILPSSMISCLQIFVSALGVFAIVPLTNAWLLVPTFAVLIIFFLLRKVYLKSSCTIKRIEGIARSPVFTHLTFSLRGLSTAHALQGINHLNKDFNQHQDRHTATWYTFIASGRAISLWLDIVCAIYNALVTTSFIFMKSSSFGGNVGLAITQTTALTSNLQWGMRQSAEVENYMTSVERILEYTKLKEENPLESVPGKIPCKGWPDKGKICFKNISLRYSPSSPWVLKDLSFTILPSQKVGVVGRTGAGKSSLLSALFRLVELRGSIEIDGVEVTSMGLWDLRSKISVIPQDPVLFSGTLRHNLDPFSEFSDVLLWKALEQVELKNYVAGLNFGLELMIDESGSNLSVGQKQLISLARALVRQNQILVLDEPTANVDTRTDYFIQETIRKRFKHCTVITIAHRLNSIIDSDVVMVMDFGKLVEFAHPYELLQNTSGYFYELAEQTGCFQDLYAVAAQRFRQGECL